MLMAEEIQPPPQNLVCHQGLALPERYLARIGSLHPQMSQRGGGDK